MTSTRFNEVLGSTSVLGQGPPPFTGGGVNSDCASDDGGTPESMLHHRAIQDRRTNRPGRDAGRARGELDGGSWGVRAGKGEEGAGQAVGLVVRRTRWRGLGRIRLRGGSSGALGPEFHGPGTLPTEAVRAGFDEMRGRRQERDQRIDDREHSQSTSTKSCGPRGSSAPGGAMAVLGQYSHYQCCTPPVSDRFRPSPQERGGIGSPAVTARPIARGT